MIARLLDTSSSHSPLDLAVAASASFLILLSAAAASLLLLSLLRASRAHHRSHLRYLGLNSLWPVRLLLVLFSALWAATELLRLPLLHLRFRPASFCRAYLILSQAFAEPAFFATLLFLLRASTYPPKAAFPSAWAAFAAALLVSVAASLPFLILHAVFLTFPSAQPDVFGAATYVVGNDPQRCGYPLVTTVLLGGLGAVYVPLFVSASWAAVTVVINKRLRLRLYALAAAVVSAMLVQVSALAVSSLMTPGGALSQVLGLAALLAVFVAVVAGEGILVVQPVVDALTVVEPQLGVQHGSTGV